MSSQTRTCARYRRITLTLTGILILSLTLTGIISLTLILNRIMILFRSLALTPTRTHSSALANTHAPTLDIAPNYVC